MSKTGETFFIRIGCMDGRVQRVVADYGRKRFDVLYADTITEAGLVGLLTKEYVEVSLLKSLKKKIDISLNLHKAKGIVVHGHQECAGNPVPDDTQKKDIQRTIEVIKFLAGPSVPVTGLFVKRKNGSKNGEWEVEELPLETV